jgi:cardiolipin synthase A/B
LPHNRLSAIALLSAVVVLMVAACGGSSTSGLTTPEPDGGATSSSGTLPDGAPAGDGGSSGTSGASGSTSGTLPDGAPNPDAGGSSSGAIPFTSAVQIIVEPSDNGAALVSAINAAKTSVHMTMYLLTYNGPVYKALVAAKSKAEVKVVLNQTFPAGQGSNTQTFNGLKAAGVSVVWAPAVYTFTHEKCAIIDNATAWIMTMNATDTSPTANREYLAIDTDADDVKNAEAIFEEDFTGAAANVSGKLVLAPINAKARLYALIKTATKSIDVEGEEFSDVDLTSILAAKADAGVAVRLIVADNTPTPAQQTAVTTLKAHKVPVKSVSTPYIHAKAIVIDGTSAYVGSANFTAGSMTGNRELGVLFDTASEVSKVATTIGTDFAAGTAL